ncbi:putative l-ascorbate oxidase protein [Eutypa lata UCREL1]|uniref:Putative l-ascorbate oxidase protein n=1 Tax=Eutypa lata (strain UCR-EL1) TaxID=1287681 RepID=M7T7U5_EUTLA|nr:putative l-ascorbate oxidase protein [Eutypa lata UCREL1]
MDVERNGLLKFQLNDLAWDAASFQSRPGATPFLIDAYINQKTPDYDAAIANSGWDPKTLGFPVRVGEVIDIVWQQTNIDPRQSYDYHPMHAHGERYWDLGSGSGQYDPTENEQRFANYTPAQRDTTMLYSYNGKTDESTSGWRAWRIKVTEENVGMQTIWVFGDATTILNKLPYSYIAGYLEYGGSAYGNDSYDPLVLSYFD